MTMTDLSSKDHSICSNSFFREEEELRLAFMPPPVQVAQGERFASRSPGVQKIHLTQTSFHWVQLQEQAPLTSSSPGSEELSEQSQIMSFSCESDAPACGRIVRRLILKTNQIRLCLCSTLSHLMRVPHILCVECVEKNVRF